MKNRWINEASKELGLTPNDPLVIDRAFELCSIEHKEHSVTITISVYQEKLDRLQHLTAENERLKEIPCGSMDWLKAQAGYQKIEQLIKDENVRIALHDILNPLLQAEKKYDDLKEMIKLFNIEADADGKPTAQDVISLFRTSFQDELNTGR